MKLDINLRLGSDSSEHSLELPAPADDASGACKVRFSLDGGTAEADWAEVAPGTYSIILDGRSHEARVARTVDGSRARGGCLTVIAGGREYQVEFKDPRQRRRGGGSGTAEGPQEILAPMPGKIVKVLVAEGEALNTGDGLLVMEAMKMQNEIRAGRPGRVDKVYVSEGAGVETGSRLVRLI